MLQISGVRKTVISAALALLIAACGPNPVAPPAGEPEPVATTAPTSAPPKLATSTLKSAPSPSTPIKRVPVSTQSPPTDLWKKFSGEHALRTVKQLAEIGPRPAGSQETGLARGLLTAALRDAGWEVEQQSFTATTPRGDLAGANLIARFSADGARPVPRTPRSIVIGAHYDTRYFSTIRFVGANDGASGPAVLVEAARVLALDPPFAAKVELVLFDAGEPRSQFSAEDGLAGSKHYAKTGAPRRAAILHGIGDTTSVLTLPPGTANDLLGELRAGASALRSPLQFQVARVQLWGDHLPLGPGALLIGNHDYLARYTADDTIEHVNSQTLGHVGELVVWLAKRWAAQPQ